MSEDIAVYRCPVTPNTIITSYGTLRLSPDIQKRMEVGDLAQDELVMDMRTLLEIYWRYGKQLEVF